MADSGERIASRAATLGGGGGSVFAATGTLEDRATEEDLDRAFVLTSSSSWEGGVSSGFDLGGEELASVEEGRSPNFCWYSSRRSTRRAIWVWARSRSELIEQKKKKYQRKDMNRS
jgi:hypothetical protein